MRFTSLLFLITLSILATAQTDNFSNTKRGTLYSEILSMNKNYQIFLPESYHYSENSSYPVVYIVDGDYNFYYQTGIVESLSNISEKIPELIVVGISDNGNEGYRKDCTLKSKTNPNGNAENFINYIEKELKPEIEKQFRVSSYEILMGHSLGGLFTTNVSLHHPDLFSAYIAIDPSYWWDDYRIVSDADSLYKNKKDLESKLFVTLADSKRMGVHEFLGVAEKYFPDTKQLTFKYYEDETHGSVGILSVRDGLVKIFESWELTREKFYNFKSSSEVMAHYKNLSKQYNSKLRIPPFQLSNIIYFYFRNDKMDELTLLEHEIKTHFPSSIDDYYSKLATYLMEKEKYEEAKKTLEKSIKSNPNAYKSHDALSKLYYVKEDFPKAKQYAEKAISIAKKLRVRQWQLNELQSNLDKVNGKVKEK